MPVHYLQQKISKGFDLSECDYLIFDEFIPKRHERLNRNEGDQLMDIYMTVSRDRVQRGRGELTDMPCKCYQYQ